jgi:hypothetical protein
VKHIPKRLKRAWEFQELNMASKQWIAVTLLASAAFSTAAFADDRGVNTAIGAVVGAVVGNHVHGSNGAIVGGVIGAAVGASVPTYDQARYASSGGYYDQPVVYTQPVTYYQPAPVYYRPAPVYYRPAPVVYYSPRPVYVGSYYGGYNGHHHDHHEWDRGGYEHPGRHDRDEGRMQHGDGNHSRR